MTITHDFPKALHAATTMEFSQSRFLQSKAHSLIPGGAHTYAKGDDQFPEQSPGFIVRGNGCHVWDADGNEFIEYGMGLRSVTLGHAYEPVVRAAQGQMELGANFGRPAAICRPIRMTVGSCRRFRTLSWLRLTRLAVHRFGQFVRRRR